jgi:hypothetical protein
LLVRVNAAAAGIAAYLETGIKRGREFDRALIDERLVLDGDLAMVDAVIDCIETAQEGDARYLHITLGLSERFTAADVCGPGEVNLAKLKEITDAYRDGLMSAYDPREYAWYAEAHIPKVTHELHSTSGEYIERLPHVHIVLPMRNLEDGRYLNPFGHGRSTLDYAQALQEEINGRFGLRSPQDSRREQPPINALARHTDRLAPGTPKEIRHAVDELVRSGKVANFDELAAKLAAFGEIRVRAGKDGDYLNIKPTWADKGINLKTFTRVNFHAAAAAARASAAAAPPQDFARLAGEWRDRACLEARYLASSNRSHYKKLDAGARQAWLEEKVRASRTRLDSHEERFAAAVAARIRSKEKSNDKDTRSGPGFHTTRDAWRAAGLYQSGLEQAASRKSAQTLSSVRNLSSLPMVQRGRKAKVLLQGDAPDRMGRRGKAGDEMRRSGARNSGAPGKGRKPITVAETLLAARARAGPSADRLKSDTSPTIALAAAARLFKIDLAQYGIGSGRDGTPRILHADKQYNLGDFFTKHLNISWEAAKPILTDCYSATLSDALPPPDRNLWKSFTAWRNQAFEERRTVAERARTEGRARLLDARDEYKRTKINARALPVRQRQAALAAARAAQLVAEAAAKQRTQELRAASRRPSRNAEYRDFLTDLANRGNLAALGELRRAATQDRDPFEGLAAAQSKAVLPLPSYKIDHMGRVTYFKDQQSIVADSVKGVSVLVRDRVAYETALKVAVARYGRDLTLHGGKAFIDNLVQAARRSGLELTIRNADKPQAPPIRIDRLERGR